ncbi:MAG TPA: TetR/AcrR family transcriptional regulator [Roseiflexaceae bacterium]|nr:TetR/AcrR family transcriptional regulator [Roseiflexaceae bacterium]
MRKGEETRERIVAQAAAVFNVQGYAGTAIGDIMRVTGLEKGGIYRHFDSKEQIALAAFDYASGLVRQRFAEKLAGQAHAADTLIAFVEVFRSYVNNPPLVGGCPILNTAIESDDTHPLLRERAAAVIEEWRALLRATVSGGIGRGEIRPDVDGEGLALLLIGTMEGAVMLAKLLGNPAPLEQSSAHLRQYIEMAVRQR